MRVSRALPGTRKSESVSLSLNSITDSTAFRKRWSRWTTNELLSNFKGNKTRKEMWFEKTEASWNQMNLGTSLAWFSDRCQLHQCTGIRFEARGFLLCRRINDATLSLESNFQSLVNPCEFYVTISAWLRIRFSCGALAYCSEIQFKWNKPLIRNRIVQIRISRKHQ